MADPTEKNGSFDFLIAPGTSFAEKLHVDRRPVSFALPKSPAK
jgi:hypothetical protein